MAFTNGTNGATDTSQINVSHIVEALEIVHGGSSKVNNDDRRNASNYLEDIKQKDNIAEVGFSLANDTNQQPLVRHFGLSLLEHVVKHQSFALNDNSAAQLREVILSLSQTLDSTPQIFIRNKIAGLWVELAKRSWALDWFNLDEYLVQLWPQSRVCKDFVLFVLDNLSEDVFNREDATAILRGRDLNEAVLEVFSSPANFVGGLKVGGTSYQMRHGDEGWSTRTTTLLRELLQQQELDKESRKLCISCLAVLRSAFSWLMTPAIINANTMPVVCTVLTRQDPELILAGIDTLIALYGRKLEEVEVQALVHPLCQAENVHVIRNVYDWSVVGPDETLDPRYAISKKISELVFHMTAACVANELPPDVDFTSFLQFLTQIVQHDSLIVSIAALHSWDKVLQAHKWRRSSFVQSCIEPLLQVAMRRIVAYDQFPEDTEEPAITFVNDEIELHPERQGFYLNYRRFCYSVIEWISYSFTEDALAFILSRVDQGLDDVAKADANQDMDQWTKSDSYSIQAEALFQVIDAAFRGIDKWRTARQERAEPAIKERQEAMQHKIREWSLSMLSNRRFRDPNIVHRQIKNAVETSSRNLKSDTEFAFKVMQHILSSLVPAVSKSSAFVDAVNDLQSYAISELRRLCFEHATYFVTFYDELESKLSSLISTAGIEGRLHVDLKAILMILVEHAEGISPEIRRSKLEGFISPLKEAWARSEVNVSDFDTFVRFLGFDQAGQYFEHSNAGSVEDWTTVGFGEEAAQIQTRMNDNAHTLPLRETRILLSVSTDRLVENSELYRIVCDVWRPLLTAVIENALRISNYAHQLHDPNTWPNVSEKTFPIIRRVLRDRYWQSGISGGSMNDFHANVRATKQTLEGFASSLRGRIRLTLENCYSIIHTLGRLGSNFYSLPQIPQMIANALLENSTILRPHHFGQLLAMIPKLIDECPSQDREHFLTPVLSTLLTRIQLKCTSEWSTIVDRGTNGLSADNLSDEMRDESVLRQMTSRAVSMVSLWIDPQRAVLLANSKRAIQRPNQTTDSSDTATSDSQPLRSFVLSNLIILEPLLTFCTSTLSYKDTKTCATMCSTLQHLVPAYSTDKYLSGPAAASVREYLSSDLFKAAINSLNDGYFADYHGHLAVLIATIWMTFGLPARVPATPERPAYERPAFTETPVNVLLSIPGLTQEQVHTAAGKLMALEITGGQRRMRSVVLQLLEGVKGVRVSELGKYDTKVLKSKLLEKYKARDAVGMQDVEVVEGRTTEDGPDLAGVADMFG